MEADDMSVENDFPTVEELSNGFSEFKLECTNEFIGKTLHLYDEKNNQVDYTFTDSVNLEISYFGTKQSKITVSAYTIVCPRNGIYMLDYIESHEKAKSVTIVIDINPGIATIMNAQLPTKEEADISQLIRAKKNMPMTSVKAEFIHASVDAPFTENTLKHEFTQDLVGKHIRFQYSSNDTYEHIYLNDKFYTWHCVKGIEKGLCDTDRCYYLKITDHLYWFTWIEKVVPTIGTVMEDLSPEIMRSFGKIAGYESYDHGDITNFQVGSYATEL